MASSKSFKVAIVGDIKDASRSLQSMEKRTKKFGSAMKAAGAAMVAAFAVNKVADLIGASIKRAEEMNSLYAATETIVANMGQVTGKTADDIKAMNKQMSLMTGIDKAVITESTNILLTFGNVGADAFDRASIAVHDMATVFKTDASSAATQLGKALNDPIAGIASLGRVGVQFTDDQKDMIEALVEAGDMAGAQAIIMDELEGQVGGAAAATADATAKLGNMWKEAQESIGNKLLPLIDKLATFMAEKVIPAFSKAGDWIKKNVPPWYTKHLKPTFDKIEKVARTVIEWLADFWEEHGDRIIEEAKTLAGLVIGYYQGIWNVIQTVLGPVIRWLADMWDKHGERIKDSLRAWWDVVSTILGYVYGAVKDVVRLVTAIFKGDWAGAWDIALGMVEKFQDFMKELGPKVLGYIGSLVRLIGPLALDVGKALVTGIVTGVSGMTAAITRSASSAAKALVNAFIDRWNRIDVKVTIGPLPSWLPGVGGKKWTSPDLFPDVRKLAAGGIVTDPTLALIGEAGPEAVIPLNRASGLGMNITVNTGVGDPVAIGRAVVDAISTYESVAGTDWRVA